MWIEKNNMVLCGGDGGCQNSLFRNSIKATYELVWLCDYVTRFLATSGTSAVMPTEYRRRFCI